MESEEHWGMSRRIVSVMVDVERVSERLPSSIGGAIGQYAQVSILRRYT